MSVESACQKFVQSRKSLVLSTLSQQGELETSVVPFVRLSQTDWGIWVSELSTHTQNLGFLTQQNNLKNGVQNQQAWSVDCCWLTKVTRRKCLPVSA